MLTTITAIIQPLPGIISWYYTSQKEKQSKLLQVLLY